MAGEHTITHFSLLPQHSYNSPNLPGLLPKSSQGSLGPTVLLSLLFPVKYGLNRMSRVKQPTKNKSTKRKPTWLALAADPGGHSTGGQRHCGEGCGGSTERQGLTKVMSAEQHGGLTGVQGVRQRRRQVGRLTGDWQTDTTYMHWLVHVCMHSMHKTCTLCLVTGRLTHV